MCGIWTAHAQHVQLGMTENTRWERKKRRKDNQPRVIHDPFLPAYHEPAVLVVVHDPWLGKKYRCEPFS